MNRRRRLAQSFRGGGGIGGHGGSPNALARTTVPLDSMVDAGRSVQQRPGRSGRKSALAAPSDQRIPLRLVSLFALPSLAIPLRALPLLALLLLVVGCNGSSRPSVNSGETGQLKVVATVGMVGDLVREIGGEHVDVVQICGTGVDPHTYQPIRDDVVAIMAADLVFYCGLRLEGKMEDILRKVSKDKPTIAVAEVIEPSLLLTPEDASGHSDPHLWNDVSLWSRCAKVVGEQLAVAIPDHASEIQSKTLAYRERLKELHAWGGEVMATIPERSRLLVTSHDAFNYFGRAYGLDVMGVQGISTESEAGLRRINELVDTLIERDVKAVFVESSVPRRNIEALVEGTQSRGHKVIVGGELFSDAMGSPGTYEGTYVGMLDHNLTTAARALGGKVDAGGFQGKLSEVADSATH
ncbi:MAG: zinc ABC transporter substrate-binding protein [Planctomycetota bacterium]